MVFVVKWKHASVSFVQASSQVDNLNTPTTIKHNETTSGVTEAQNGENSEETAEHSVNIWYLVIYATMLAISAWKRNNISAHSICGYFRNPKSIRESL